MIYLIADSVGCKRTGVHQSNTYPHLIKMSRGDVVVKAYYSLTLLKAMDWLTGMDIDASDKIILQAGIVDCVTEGITPSEIKTFMLSNRISDKYRDQTHVVGLIYYGPASDNVEYYNEIFRDIYGRRYIDTSAIENSHTIDDGIHLTIGGHIEMSMIIQEAIK